MDDCNKKRKSPWRFAFLAVGAYGAVKLLGGLWINLIYMLVRTQTLVSVSESYSVGVIGGADGPTAVFISSPVWFSYIIPAACLTVGILGFAKLNRK